MSDSTDLDAALDELESATDLSMDVVAARNGSEEALRRLSEPRLMEMQFPGPSREVALGYAEKLVSDLEELGVSAEKEYVELVKEGDYATIHRVDIIIEGGASQEAQRDNNTSLGGVSDE